MFCMPKTVSLSYGLKHSEFSLSSKTRRYQFSPVNINGGKRHSVVAVLEDTPNSTTSKQSLVKICGITNVEDAIAAAQAGAAYVGMILWPNSKRSVDIDTAKAISHAVRLYKAEPVGVFVDEDAETIIKWCKDANLDIAQLHGERARSSLVNLPSYLRTIYVLHVDENGVIQTAIPVQDQIDWVLLDSLQGGSGHKFDWEKIKAASFNFKSQWFLAGGLHPENVASAISILEPDVVDVSSGVTLPDGILKDPARISAFMRAVQRCSLVKTNQS